VDPQQKENYRLAMEKIVDSLPKTGRKPSLLLHSCCAPCSSSCLEYLCEHFDVTVYYCNPNIFPYEEYAKRAAEQQRLLSMLPFGAKTKLITAEYDHGEFLEIARELKDEPEGAERCRRCIKQRMEKTAALAKAEGFDFFCTTLSVSPHKDAQYINLAGRELAGEYSVPFLPSDFKKKEGYKRSIELSREYGLYRQNFCGCEFSLSAENAAPSAE